MLHDPIEGKSDFLSKRTAAYTDISSVPRCKERHFYENVSELHLPFVHVNIRLGNLNTHAGL